jgi:Uma2 family endonuclease
MHSASQTEVIPVDVYLAGEDGADVRHEYIGGRVYAMTGASREHCLITLNITASLMPATRARSCQTFVNAMKVRLEISGVDVFYYPDILVTCDPADRERYYCTAPCLIVEVLCEHTERTDRREKYLAYQTLPSLEAYVLVSQDRRLIEVFRRSHHWHPELLTEGGLRVACLDATLPLDAIYARVGLPD